MKKADGVQRDPVKGRFLKFQELPHQCHERSYKQAKDRPLRTSRLGVYRNKSYVKKEADFCFLVSTDFSLSSFQQDLSAVQNMPRVHPKSNGEEEVESVSATSTPNQVVTSRATPECIQERRTTSVLFPAATRDVRDRTTYNNTIESIYLLGHGVHLHGHLPPDVEGAGQQIIMLLRLLLSKIIV
ncbi:hypothetical protein LENED_001838 [Lentinula edodes]|uniref:Uncharacterized protein n=1 Tax=Lentinula edodes TaxID=5353 RepID=A0A1Q3DZ90_LENED|nr:hypothetical protein LENED_001838 [Lentinula edodes]